MEESVTLKLGRYEALRDKARRVDALEKWNKMLKEDLEIAHKHLEKLRQPEEEEPTCEERIVNPKFAEPSEESKEKFRARYPEGVTVISVDDLKKSILLCDKGIYSVEDKEKVRRVATIKESSSHEQSEECSEEDEKDVVTINGKSVKDILKENEILHKMADFKHYAKGGLATKGEVTELKRSKKNK